MNILTGFVNGEQRSYDRDLEADTGEIQCNSRVRNRIRNCRRKG